MLTKIKKINNYHFYFHKMYGNCNLVKLFNDVKLYFNKRTD